MTLPPLQLVRPSGKRDEHLEKRPGAHDLPAAASVPLFYNDSALLWKLTS